MRFRELWGVEPCSDVEITDVSEVSTALMTEAVRTSETSVHFVTTRRYIPEDSKLLEINVLSRSLA
jgi:hypothetical protein